MFLQTCMKARGRKDERWSTLWFPLTYFPLLILNSAIGALGSHTFLSDMGWKQHSIPSHSSAETVPDMLALSSCVSLAGSELWHRRLTSVLSGVDWGSCSAQLDIQQIYLEHEDKVVHLENDCDSGQPWCPLQLHRRAWPGSVYWTRLNPQPRCFDSYSVRGHIRSPLGGEHLIRHEWNESSLVQFFKSRLSKDNSDELNWYFTLKEVVSIIFLLSCLV